MPDNSEDFLSFEKALRELKMRSEELKKLVSEGEIRAFRDGDSMKFRREDIASLSVKADGESELSFADSLEDDTGMVTEQISDEDTLLADDDELATQPTRRERPVRATRATAPVAVAVAAEREPTWVTVMAAVGMVVMIWGLMVCYSIVKESNPKDSFFTSAFAEEKK